MAIKPGKFLILIVFVCGGVASYQHHITMRQERDRAKRTSDKFEVLYTKELDTVAEWKQKYDTERYMASRLQAKEKELQQSVEQLQSQLTAEREAHDAATAKVNSLEMSLRTTKESLEAQNFKKQQENEVLLKQVEGLKNDASVEWQKSEQLRNTIKQMEVQSKALSVKNYGLQQQLASQESQLKLLKSQTATHAAQVAQDHPAQVAQAHPPQVAQAHPTQVAQAHTTQAPQVKTTPKVQAKPVQQMMMPKPGNATSS